MVGLALCGLAGPALADDQSYQLAGYNYDFSEFIDWVRHATDERGIPGAALAIVSREGVRHLHTWGVRKIDDPDAVTVDSVFRIASMSKPVAGVALLMLLEEGKLRLEDPVSKFIPSFAEAEVAMADAAWAWS